MAYDAAGSAGRDDYLLGRSTVLLRLAHQLTGDPAAALGLACFAASALPRRGTGPDLDYAATVAMVRATVRRRTSGDRPTASALDSLRSRQRVAVVLAFGLGWDAETIAEARRSSPRRVRRDVAIALSAQPESDWRAMLAEPRWSLAPPEDLTVQVRAVRGRRRTRSRARLLAVCSAATAVVGLVAAIARVVGAPGPTPATAHEAGLLAWSPRGPLIRDAAFVRAATAHWRAAQRPPAGPVYVLYAGRVGAGRIAVLQARGASGLGEVAVVADHDVSYRHTTLRLDEVSLLARTDVPVLAIPYDGNLDVPRLLAGGPGSRVEQLLVAPGVARVEERSLRDPIAENRPAFVVQHVTDGMSDPWLDLTGTLPSTAVRVLRTGAPPFSGILVPGLLQPVPLSGATGELFSEWTGLPHVFRGSELQDDVVWWSQVCTAPDPDVQLVWTGGAPGFPAPVRLELVRCPGGTLTAEFLTGFGSQARLLTEDGGFADVYAAELVPGSLGRSYFLVVGSRRVRTITVGGETTRTRVAVVPIEQSGSVRVTDAAGQPISLR